MKSIATSAAGLLLLLTTGCSPSRPSPEFRHQLSLADRIIVTNQYRPVTLTVTGKDLRDVSTAVANATEDKNHYLSVCDWEIQFYAGSNFLMTIYLQDRTFWSGTNQYTDSSGVLKRFWQTLEEHARRE